MRPKRLGKILAHWLGCKDLFLRFQCAQGCIKLLIQLLRDRTRAMADRWVRLICQIKRTSSPQPSPPSDGGEGENQSLRQPCDVRGATRHDVGKEGIWALDFGLGRLG